MDLMEQCRIWHNNKEDDKVVETLKKVPGKDLTQDLSFIYARSCNSLAANDLFDERTYAKARSELHRALDLLLPLKGALSKDFEYNYETGFSYLYLEQEYDAMPYLTKALELLPENDESAKTDLADLLGIANDRMSIPTYQRCFEKRTKDAWEAFEQEEAELRQLMDTDAPRDVVMTRARKALSLAFQDPSFELGEEDGRYKLIFLPQGDKVRLFVYAYFQAHAPASVKAFWDVIVGRQPMKDVSFSLGEAMITPDDCLFWIEEIGEESYQISIYSEKLNSVSEQKRWWYASTLVDCVLGEIPAYRYLTKFDVLKKPADSEGQILTRLPAVLEDLGLDISADAVSYLEALTVYGSTPTDEDDDIWRDDVVTGSTNCMPLISDYMHGDYSHDASLRRDGIAAGFFCYPLEYFDPEKRDEEIMLFRTELTDAVLSGAGPDAVVFTGGATGVDNGYLDFIAWDIDAVLDTARDYFTKRRNEIPWIGFHAFRRDVRIAVIEDGSEDGMRSDGIFTGSILLSDPSFDRAQLLKDLKDLWRLEPKGKDENTTDSLAFTQDDLFAVVRLSSSPIPDQEAELAAQNNYLWPDAVEKAKGHKATLEVAVIGTDKTRLEAGKLFVKIAAACCRQKNCSAVYANDIVVSPEFYESCSKLMEDDELPILNWIWFGLYRGKDDKISGYTHGMEAFDLKELEIVNTWQEPTLVRSILVNLVSVELDDNMELTDGTVVGMPIEGKEISWHEIHRGPGAAYPGQETLHVTVAEPDRTPFVLEKADPKDQVAIGREAVFLAFASSRGLLKEQLPDKDILSYVREDLHGVLTSDLLNAFGYPFAAGYYRQDKEPFCVPSFVFDSMLYEGQALADMLERRYVSYQNQVFFGGPDPDEAARHLMAQLPEKGYYFPAMRDDDPLKAGLTYLRAFQEEKTWPVLVCTGDGSLAQPDSVANPDNGFLLYWDTKENRTRPVILTRIVCESPWEVLRNFFDNPGVVEAAKHFYECYQAEPATIAATGVEFLLPKPIPKEKAAEEAAYQKEKFPEMFEGIDLKSYEKYLTSATVWHFWWKSTT